MKPATLLALPALALAAATPAKVEERQLPGLDRLLDLECVQRVLGVTSCFTIPTNPTDPLPVADLIGLITCPPIIVFRVALCLLPL